MKGKAFFIVFKEFPLSHFRQMILEGEGPTLNPRGSSYCQINKFCFIPMKPRPVESLLCNF